MSYWTLQGISFGLTLLYSSYFEWFLHKYFMHRPTIFYYPFKAHALIHHQVFKWDASYNLKNPEDKWLITMAWWNYPLLLLIHAPLFAALEILGLRITVGAVLGMSLYYGVYEYLHFCYHCPEGRSFERLPLYQFIRRHHRIHHKFMNRNLNVVFPLADLTLGTFVKNPYPPLENDTVPATASSPTRPLEKVH